MLRERIRIGSPFYVNESKLEPVDGFDVLFDKYHEFVYIPDFEPRQLVNGTWRGALRYLINGMKRAERLLMISRPSYPLT